MSDKKPPVDQPFSLSPKITLIVKDKAIVRVEIQGKIKVEMKEMRTGREAVRQLEQMQMMQWSEPFPIHELERAMPQPED